MKDFCKQKSVQNVSTNQKTKNEQTFGKKLKQKM